MHLIKIPFVKNYNSFAEVKAELLNNTTTCVDLTKSFLQQIHANQNLNVFLEVFEKSALEKAVQVDEKIRSKTAGKLAGMVIALKDNLCYKDHKVSASSKILEGFESLYSATVVERLLAEDAIIIGRCNCDEF
ncbi:MAG TPA: amidase family protein, partial [Bacteroidia bacterium]